MRVRSGRMMLELLHYELDFISPIESHHCDIFFCKIYFSYIWYFELNKTFGPT